MAQWHNGQSKPAWYENMTSSVKPLIPVHNVSQFATPSEEDRSTTAGNTNKLNMHKKLRKFGRALFELCERTDRKTDVSEIR